jgi:hypothetical protein
VQGIDGPVRATVDVTVEPLTEASSRLTIAVDFDGHGIGKLLIPLIVRRQAHEEMPANVEALKRRVEAQPPQRPAQDQAREIAWAIRGAQPRWPARSRRLLTSLTRCAGPAVASPARQLTARAARPGPAGWASRRHKKGPVRYAGPSNRCSWPAGARNRRCGEPLPQPPIRPLYVRNHCDTASRDGT